MRVYKSVDTWLVKMPWSWTQSWYFLLCVNGKVLFLFSIPPFHAEHQWCSSSMELFCKRRCCFHKFSTNAILYELGCWTFIIDVELYEGNTQCRVNTTQASALANCDAGSMYMLFLIQICYKVLWHLAFRINIYQKLNISLFLFAEWFCKMLPGHFAVEQLSRLVFERTQYCVISNHLDISVFYRNVWWLIW